jgi:dTDP-4-dehydrorhamnose reductase
MPDTFLITGGAGMLARAFRDLLTERKLAHVAPPRAELDITSVPQILSAIDRVKPTVVLNCAAYTKVDLAEKEQQQANAINGQAVGALAEACRLRGVTLVHFSTDYVFDGSLRRPLKPDDPIGPKGAYGVSKALGERMLKEFEPARWLILRTAWLYGPGGPNFPQAMLNAARAGKPLKVIDDQIGCPTFTRDLAEATLNLLDTGASGIYHLSNSGETSWFKFAGAIFEEFAVTPSSFVPITSDDWKQIKPDSAHRPAYSVFDVSPYEAATGKRMPEWRDGLKRYRAEID